MGRLNAKRSSLDADVPSSGISFVLQKVTLTPLMPDTINGLQGIKNTQWLSLLFEGRFAIVCFLFVYSFWFLVLMNTL